MSEIQQLIQAETDLIGWDLRPDDGKRLINSHSYVATIRAGAKHSVVLIHSTKTREIAAVAEMLKPDYILMSSARDDNELRAIKDALPKGTRLMVSLGLPTAGSQESFDYATKFQAYQEVADVIIFDTISTNAEKNSFGCSGRTSNWSVAASLVEKSKKPIILAGGLNPENLITAIEVVKPWGVDACTSLELFDKSKDISRCATFNRIAHQ